MEDDNVYLTLSSLKCVFLHPFFPVLKAVLHAGMCVVLVPFYFILFYLFILRGELLGDGVDQMCEFFEVF